MNCPECETELERKEHQVGVIPAVTYRCLNTGCNFIDTQYFDPMGESVRDPDM